MEKIMNWIASIDLNSTQIVAIVIFFLYILGSIIGIGIIAMTGQGYMDLARGLRKILERKDAENKLDDIDELTEEISRYYDSYAKYNPSVRQRYTCIINWLDDILLQTNMFKKRKKYGTWFDEYYNVLNSVQQCFEKKYPYYHCTAAQSQILEEMSCLKHEEDQDQVEKLVKKTETEFMQLNTSGIKNERTNYISVAIGVAGILVSVLLTVLQMVG